MGMADTLMVAGVGEAAVSSVSLVDSLNILIIQILSALATGGAVIASQYLGRRDEENASRSAAQLYSVLGISTVAVGVVCMLLSRLILRMVFGSIDDTHRNRRDAQHAVQLGGAAAGVFLNPAAQILAGNDSTAGSQRGQNLNNQNIQAVHERYAGDSGLTHTSDHQRVGHAHRDA
jgi:Na+-driven multidrug efflux pump